MGAKYDFTASNGSLIMKRTPVLGDVLPKTITFRSPSLVSALGKIRLYESGKYYTSLLFTGFGLIDGVAPTSLGDAETKLIALMAGTNGGSTSGSYNTPTIYDTPADLPIEFDANSIHSISVLALTGTTTIEVDGEETVLSEGQEYFNEASALIDVQILINSTTGTFIVTTIN